MVRNGWANGLPDVQNGKLAALGIADAFCCVARSANLGVEKPDPAIFHRACEEAGVAPGDCLHVGDSFEDDVRGALGAGLGACWLNPEGVPPPSGLPEPTFTIRCIEELLRR